MNVQTCINSISTWLIVGAHMIDHAYFSPTRILPDMIQALPIECLCLGWAIIGRWSKLPETNWCEES